MEGWRLEAVPFQSRYKELLVKSSYSLRAEPPESIDPILRFGQGGLGG